MINNSPQTSKKKHQTILIADDDTGILDSVRILLEEFNFDVQTTSNGRKLLSMKTNFPDLILLDVWMSGMDGGEICKFLKNRAATSHIPIIIISANKDTAQIAKDSGADDFITKPFEMEFLISKINKHIKN